MKVGTNLLASYLFVTAEGLKTHTAFKAFNLKKQLFC